MVVIIKIIISLDCFEPIQLTCITKVSISLYDVKSVFAAMDGRKKFGPPFSQKGPPFEKLRGGGALSVKSVE